MVKGCQKVSIPSQQDKFSKSGHKWLRVLKKCSKVSDKVKFSCGKKVVKVSLTVVWKLAKSCQKWVQN